jgi:hypothetical protein
VKPFFDQFPDVDQLLGFKPEDLVPALLRLALARGRGTMFLPKTLSMRALDAPTHLISGRMLADL